MGTCTTKDGVDIFSGLGERPAGGRSSQPWDGNDLTTYAEDLAGLVEHLDLRAGLHPVHRRGRVGRLLRGHAAAGAARLRRGDHAQCRDAPVGMRDIEVVAELDTDADDTALERLAQLTERYCVVAQTLAVTPHLTVRRTVPVSG